VYEANFSECEICGTLALLGKGSIVNTPQKILDKPTYDPNPLLDFIIQKLQLKNDAALSRRLQIGPAVISKLRHRTLAVGPNLMIRIHDEANMSITDIRRLCGIR